MSDSQSSRKIRGLRLKALRKSLNLSRSEFAEKIGVSAYTVQNWEVNKNNGLSEDRTGYVINHLNRMGVDCSFSWMAHGTGVAPMIADPVSGQLTFNETHVAKTIEKEQRESMIIEQELALFKAHCTNEPAFLIIQDESMAPRYKPGDYVAGNTYKGKQMSLAIDLDCIVQLETGEKILRTVKQGSVDGRFTLISTNLNTLDVNSFIYDVKLSTLAPVVWVRKPTPQPLLRTNV